MNILGVAFFTLMVLFPYRRGICDRCYMWYLGRWGFFFLDLNGKIVSAPLITHRYRDLGTDGLLIERDGPYR